VSKRKYGILIDFAQCACEICGKPLQKGKGKSGIDHNHETGELRGILCIQCNSLLGFAKDNVATLKSAIKYLHKYADPLSEKKAG